MNVRSLFFRSLLALVLASLSGCGDDDTTSGDTSPDVSAPDVETDARSDANATDTSAVTDAQGDAPLPDVGPPPTGCELIGTPPRDAERFDTLPPPSAFPPISGPGGPVRLFSEAALFEACSFLDGGPSDRDHHNAVTMVDGYLFMPWAHEAGHGGITVFDFDQPCAPVVVGSVTSDDMRETHGAGFATIGAQRFMVVTSLTGVQFWDVTDVRDMQLVRDFALPGVVYPDSYARVVMSTSWQYPYVYVGASDNGVFIVDAADPAEPVLVAQYETLPKFRVGGVHAIGNLLAVFPSEGARTALLDIGDPADPRPIPGGTYVLSDGSLDRYGRPTVRNAYFAQLNGDRAFYARHLLGGGLITYDISDATNPRAIGNRESFEFGGNGGYVYLKEDHAFVGLSGYGEIIDVRAPNLEMDREARIEMTGDLDTMVPIGNVIVASVDDDAIPDRASWVIPYELDPDTRAPVVNMVRPQDGEERVPLSARVGVTFDEFVDLATIFPGSFYVRAVGDEAPLPGFYSGQEGAVNFWPAGPLDPDTEYEVVIPAGGAQDVSGNATTSAFRSTFRTVSCDG